MSQWSRSTGPRDHLPRGRARSLGPIWPRGPVERDQTHSRLLQSGRRFSFDSSMVQGKGGEGGLLRWNCCHAKLLPKDGRRASLPAGALLPPRKSRARLGPPGGILAYMLTRFFYVYVLNRLAYVATPVRDGQGLAGVQVGPQPQVCGLWGWKRGYVAMPSRLEHRCKTRGRETRARNRDSERDEQNSH